MMTTPRPRQKRTLEKREALLNAAAREFREKGFEATTTKSIASRAGVATGSFYQHFANKQIILHDLARARYQQVEDPIQPPGPLSADNSNSVVRQILRRALETIHAFHEQESGLHEVLEQRRCVDSELNAIMDHGEQRTQARIAALLRQIHHPSPEITAYCLYSMAEGLIHRHVFYSSDFDRDAVIEQAVSIMASHLEGNLVQ